MVIAKGVNIKTAAKWCDGWGQETTLGADDSFQVLSSDIQGALDLLPNESMAGTPHQPIFTAGAIMANGSISVYAKYDGLDMFVAMAMGQCADPDGGGDDGHQVGSGPAGYYNWYSVRQALSGLYATFGIDREVDIQVIDSVTVNQLTIRGEAGQRCEFQFDLLGREASSSSALNTSSATWSQPTPIEFIMFKDSKFYANIQSGAALGPDDMFYPSSFEVVVNNTMVADLTAKNDPYQDAPDRDGWSEVTANFSLPRFEDNRFDVAYLAGTPMKMGLVFTDQNQIGAAGSGEYYYQFRIWLPQVQVSEAPRAVGGPEKIPGDFSIVATKPESAPTGFTGVGALEGHGDNSGVTPAPWKTVTDAIVIEVMNTKPDKPLPRDF